MHAQYHCNDTYLLESVREVNFISVIISRIYTGQVPRVVMSIPGITL